MFPSRLRPHLPDVGSVQLICLSQYQLSQSITGAATLLSVAIKAPITATSLRPWMSFFPTTEQHHPDLVVKTHSSGHKYPSSYTSSHASNGWLIQYDYP